MPLRRRARPRRTQPPQRKRSRRPAVRSDRPRIVVVGFGRMGGAIALGLKRARWPVWVLPRSGESMRRAVDLGIPLADLESLHEADVCLFAVPDGAVGRVAEDMLLDLGLGTALVHCAGALDLEVFGQGPMVGQRPRGSFHPLVAVSDAEDPLEGHAVALSATTRPLMQIFREMAEALSLTPIEVPESGRAAYHAGAVLAAGGVVSLLSAAVAAFEVAGIRADDALRALVPLSRSALRGVAQRGLAGGLTGPIRRGDANVVRAHLGALPPELAELYRVLSRRALDLCLPSLPAEARAALEEILR